MEKQNETFTAKTKKTRFQVQKNIHIFMREMMRYFDIYLLSGSIILKGFVFGIIMYVSEVIPIIMSVLFTMEFFFLFTRIALEYHRKKNQQNVFIEVSNNRFKYTIGVFVYIPIIILWTEFSWTAAGLGLFLNAVYYYSNILLSSAAVAIHTKDVQFTEKMIGLKKTIVLNSKAEAKIIEEKKQQKFEAAPEKEEEVEKLSVEQIRKKYSNMKTQLKRVQERGDKQAISLQIDKIETFLDDLYDIEHEMFHELRKNWITIER